MRKNEGKVEGRKTTRIGKGRQRRSAMQVRMNLSCTRNMDDRLSLGLQG